MREKKLEITQLLEFADTKCGVPLSDEDSDRLRFLDLRVSLECDEKGVPIPDVVVPANNSHTAFTKLAYRLESVYEQRGVLSLGGPAEEASSEPKKSRIILEPTDEWRSTMRAIETCVRERSQTNAPVPLSVTPKRPWPNPEKHTTAKVWTVKEGSFRMSTKTDSQHDGTVEFAPTDSGELTYQMRLMQLLCFQFPKPVSLAEVIQQVYPDDFATVSGDAAALSKTLRKVRTLVSDIRKKKLANANLNPDILPALSIEVSRDTGIALQLAHLHRMDDKELDEADEPAL